MDARDHRSGVTRQPQDYRHLPAEPRLDEAIEVVDPGPTPDPEAGRNMEQHRALRDD